MAGRQWASALSAAEISKSLEKLAENAERKRIIDDMKKRYTAVFLSVLMACAGTVSCSSEKSKSSSKSSQTETDAAATSDIQTTDTMTDAPEITTAPVTEKNVTTTTTSVQSSKEAAAAGNQAGTYDSGYTDSLSIAVDFYQAYLDHDPEKVYKMFNPEEIECYKKLMADQLEGKSADEVFSKDALIKAIDDSMSMIEEIMAEFSDSENDRWTADINEEILEEIAEDELSAFNDELGTSYTSGKIVNYMNYVNADNGEPFVGNSSAFVEKNGHWYVSFSSLMQSELINQLEV